MQVNFHIWKSVNGIYHINRLKKKKNHLITSINAENANDKTQHTFIVKPRKVVIEENVFNLIKGIYLKNSIFNFIFNNKILNAFTLILLSPVLFNSSRGSSQSNSVIKENKRDIGQRGRNKNDSCL